MKLFVSQNELSIKILNRKIDNTKLIYNQCMWLNKNHVMQLSDGNNNKMYEKVVPCKDLIPAGRSTSSATRDNFFIHFNTI